MTTHSSLNLVPKKLESQGEEDVVYWLEELPSEMILSILQFCDPRTVVNVICTCNNLRRIAMKLILMGMRNYNYSGWEGIKRISDEGRERFLGFKFPIHILDLYVDYLLREDELSLEYLSLACFNNI